MSSGSSGSSTTTTQNYSPEEAARRTQVMDEAARIYNATAPALSSAAYPGARPIQFSPDTLMSQQYARDYATGPAVAQANNINQAVQFGLSDVLFPETNPALQSTINAAVRPIYQDFTDPGGVMSQIRTGAQDAGQFGSSRQGIAEGIAAGRYANAASDAAAKVATEGYNRGLDTFSRTLAFAPQALQTGLMPAQILSGVGAQNEMQASEIENYLSNAAMWQLNAPWAPLQNYASIVFGGANPSTKSVTSGGGGDNTLQTIGSAASLAMMLALFSDRRLKENVQAVGVDQRTGLPLYAFSYRGQPNRYIGVMADDVAQLYPEAVHEIAGYSAVNYTLLGIELRQVH